MEVVEAEPAFADILIGVLQGHPAVMSRASDGYRIVAADGRML